MFRTALRTMGKYLIALSTPQAEPRRSPPARPVPPGPSPNDFERKTRHLAEARKAAAIGGTPTTMVAGSVQFVGMDEIKRSLGAAWQSVADVAFAIAEETIRKHLSEQDAFRRRGEETFILTFATTNKVEAEAKTRAIVQDIRDLLAERTPEAKLELDHTVTEVDWAIVESGPESIIDSIALALRKVREEAAIAATVWRHHLIQNAAIRYSPIWNPGKRLVASYRILLDDETGKHAFQRLGAVSSPEDLRLVLFELDCLMIGRAVQALHGLLDRGGKAQLLIPVNYSTLNDRLHREQYMKLCLDVPQSYKKFVLFHLHGPMSGTPAGRIIDIGLALKLHAQGVLVDLPIDPARVQEFAGTSFHGVSINAKSLATPVLEATQRLGRLVAAARAVGLKVFVHGADTVGFAEAAVNARADYIEGRGIAMPAAEPKTAYQWNPRGIG